METLLKALLILHITFGFAALTSGLSALIAKKGNKVHRGAGKVFFYAMIGVATTAVGIAVPKNETFLLMIALFSFSMTYFGYRSTVNKNSNAAVADWLILLLAAINNFFMFYSGQIILIAFGLLSIRLIAQQFNVYLKVRNGKKLPPNTWLRQHISMMMGAFIATVTAFVVVNVHIAQLPWLPWLAPAAILYPLIIYYLRKYGTVKKPVKV